MGREITCKALAGWTYPSWSRSILTGLLCMLQSNENKRWAGGFEVLSVSTPHPSLCNPIIRPYLSGVLTHKDESQAHKYRGIGYTRRMPLFISRTAAVFEASFITGMRNRVDPVRTLNVSYGPALRGMLDGCSVTASTLTANGRISYGSSRLESDMLAGEQ